MAITKSTPAPLTGGTLWCVTIALSLATFMQMLDSTISNVAIPTISGFLGASTDEGTWVITSFGVANAIAIPVTGRLAQRIGELRLFLLSVTFFSLSSLMCSLSINLDVLIFFRVVQGLMAGPLIPLSQSLLLRNYPPEKRTFALALWSMTVIIVLTLCLTLLKGRETETSPVKMNLPGLTLLVLGVGGLQIMLDKGRDLDWFNSSTIIILTVVSVIFLISLVIWESTSENPILDLSLFKSRNFTIGIVSITCAYLFYSGAIVLMPQLLQETMGYNAIWAGLAYAPIGIMPLLISPLIGRYGNKIDMRVLVTFSFLMYAVCYYWRSVTFMPTIDFTGIILPQFFQGFAVACFFLPLTTISFSGLPDNKFANASSMSNFFRTLSGSVGTSLTMTLWGRRESLHHSQLTETIDQFNPVFNSSSQIMDKYYGSLSGVLNEINNEITQQSLSISANEIFRMAAIAFILLTVLVWFAKPPFTAKGVG
ncbi:DHA2 family efflux MFS transporter permease subunit [Escherichia coli]|nr:DHA2 family efflux MFS transporter permease subunit [Escherichia coli]EER5959146.1 DHA2 family efflux MFS transporter permease subunit [Escherichia coli]EES2884161.1 DHA2 family efflux MFS transporter permease subunit [Escherichia coli]EES8077675.1 DHA2 family efflux MFS transporter permease subunit [Escherichia coli]EEV8055107.1 DHA2 family efflux MFS transporter permease subunit [Escherichia coli]